MPETKESVVGALIAYLQKFLSDRSYTTSALKTLVEKSDHAFSRRLKYTSYTYLGTAVEDVLRTNPTLFRRTDDYGVTYEWTKCKTFNLTRYGVKDKLPSGDKKTYVAPARPEFSHLVALGPGELPADELLNSGELPDYTYQPEQSPPKGATLVLVARQMEELEHSSLLAAALAQLVLGAGGDIVYRKPS